MINTKEATAFKAFKGMSVIPDIHVLLGYMLVCP